MGTSVRLPAKRIPGKYEQLGRERQARDLREAKHRGFSYDREAAEAAVAWFPEFCRHSKGEWADRPLELRTAQADNVRQVFGWKREDGTRRFRRWWEEEARKNGKTTFAAGVSLKLLVGDDEPGAEVYWTATKRDQAGYGFTRAVEMVKKSPLLLEYIRPGRGNLYCAELGAKMEPLVADQRTTDSLSPSGDIRDEVHEWNDHRLAAKLDTARAARRQPLTLEITTAGVYDPHGVGWSHHEYATRVLDGALPDDELFAFIAAADEGDDPFDPATWWKANPGLGVAPKLEAIAKLAEDAKTGRLAINDFLRFHLNVWTRQAKRWLNYQRWLECDAKPLELSELRERPCWGGLDLSVSAVEGLPAWVLVWPLDDGGIAILPRFWIPEARLDALVRQGKRHFLEWVQAGALEIMAGDVVDQRVIRRQIVADAERFALQEGCFDEYEARKLALELGEEDGITMVKIPQTLKYLSEPSKAFEAMILSRQVHHGGHPVMAAHVEAAACRMDPNGNIAPDKTKAKDYIDGVVAIVTALARANLGEVAGGSYLDDPNAEVIQT